MQNNAILYLLTVTTMMDSISANYCSTSNFKETRMFLKHQSLIQTMDIPTLSPARYHGNTYWQLCRPCWHAGSVAGKLPLTTYTERALILIHWLTDTCVCAFPQFPDVVSLDHHAYVSFVVPTKIIVDISLHLTFNTANLEPQGSWSDLDKISWLGNFWNLANRGFSLSTSDR